jgi:hypothetical protein
LKKSRPHLFSTCPGKGTTNSQGFPTEFTGTPPYHRSSRQCARRQGSVSTADEALKDAFRNAVRQVVGAVVDADTLVKNDEVIDDKVSDLEIEDTFRPYLTSNLLIMELTGAKVIRLILVRQGSKIIECAVFIIFCVWKKSGRILGRVDFSRFPLFQSESMAGFLPMKPRGTREDGVKSCGQRC